MNRTLSVMQIQLKQVERVLANFLSIGDGLSWGSGIQFRISVPRRDALNKLFRFLAAQLAACPRLVNDRHNPFCSQRQTLVLDTQISAVILDEQ